MAGPDLNWAMRRVDAILRRRLGIVEFSDEPDCLIRISREIAPRTLTLPSGDVVPEGAPVLGIHLWNEHLPAIPNGGRTAAWGSLFARRMRRSLALLARYLETEPRYRDIAAITAAPTFPDRIGPLTLTRVCEYFGWEIVPPEQRQHAGAIHTWLDSMLIWLLIWTFNPGGLRGHGLSHGRIEVWMTRARLLDHYKARTDMRDKLPAMVKQS